MSKKLNLKIITPQKVLLEEEVDAVYSHSVEGEFGILPDHVSYMTPLDVGVTEYIKNNQKEFIPLMNKATSNKLTVKNKNNLIKTFSWKNYVNNLVKLYQ